MNKIDCKIGVAVSGGVDSMTLLYAYEKAEQNLVVVNIEHGIRGETSLRDTDFVKKYCALNNIPFLGFSVDAPKNARSGESVETCSRRLRYEIFDKLVSEGTVQKIALAHHADDNAETVLMRIFRGTGLRGLAGITDRGDYIRPLLGYSRGEIAEFAAEHNIPFVTDETNAENEYTRNYIRNELMPLIKLKYPNVLASVSRLSENALEADEYLSSLALPPEKIESGYKINGFFGQPKILQKYSVTRAVKSFGFLQDFESRHMEEVNRLAEKPNNTTINLPFGLTATKYDSTLFVSGGAEKFFETPFSAEAKFSYLGYSYRFENGDSMKRGISFDLNKLPQNAVIRQRKNGDEFKRVNGKTKLLSDFLNERKLPKPEKDALLVLAEGSTVFAVLGIETADAVKIDNDTKRIIYIIRE